MSLHLYVNNRSDLPYLRIGEPYIVDHPTMRIVEEQSCFLREHYIESGARRSRCTWIAAAHHILAWTELTQQMGIDWRDASRETLLTYRDLLLGGISPKRNQPYSNTTVRNYLLTVIAFYRFASKKGWYSGALHLDDDLPSSRFRALDRDMLAHTRNRATAPRSNDLLPRRVENLDGVRPFTVSDWRRFVQVLGPLPSERQGSGAFASRDRLICEIAVRTGLRLAELRSLRAEQFIDLTLPVEAPNAHQVVTIKGKRGTIRPVMFPNRLVQEIKLYIQFERARAVEGRVTKHEPKELFVSGASYRTPGRPLTPRRYEQIVEDGCRKAGLMKRVQKRDANTDRESEVSVPLHTFHELRHTYAVWTYSAEKMAGNPEPWKRIQIQLGHKHLQTTTDTYLRLVEVFGGHRPALDVFELLGI